MRNKLKEERVLKKMSQNKLASAIGLQRSSYTNIENGIRNPSMKVQRKIRIVLESDDENLFINE